VARKLYVGNLPYEVAEADLQQLFGTAGTVETVNVVRDMATGRARGFAFIEMSTDDEAQKAIQQFNAYAMGGRALTVNEARPKPERSGGYGGGNGGGGSRRRSEPRW
jgi:cold-inducible RNA-binding protein